MKNDAHSINDLLIDYKHTGAVISTAIQHLANGEKQIDKFQIPSINSNAICSTVCSIPSFNEIENNPFSIQPFLHIPNSSNACIYNSFIAKRILFAANQLLKRGIDKTAKEWISLMRHYTKEQSWIWNELASFENAHHNTEKAIYLYKNNNANNVLPLKHKIQLCFLLYENDCLSECHQIFSSLSKLDENVHPEYKLQSIYLEYLLGIETNKQHLLSKYSLLLKVLSNDKYPQLNQLFKPYSNRLMNRAESTFVNDNDQHAIRGLVTFYQSSIKTLHVFPSFLLDCGRWLILDGQYELARELFFKHLKQSHELEKYLAHIALFFWISNATDIGIEFYNKCTRIDTANPSIFFAHAVTSVAYGDIDSAQYYTALLSDLASDYFMNISSFKIWGMLALLLKGLGHISPANAAWQLSSQLDPFHECRAHLFNRIKEPTHSTPLPFFEFPSLISGSINN